MIHQVPGEDMSVTGWCTQGNSVPEGRADRLCVPGPGAEELEVEMPEGGAG